MTTNVFDQAGAVVATDSRWSYGLPHAAIYIDDAIFEKIVACETRGVIFMFAGNSERIHEWKQWIASPGHAVINRPGVSKGIAICMVDIATRKVVFSHNQDITNDDSCFAGTGAWSAYSCWKSNKDARKAVETAKMADRFSGGQVKFFDLTDRSHNLLGPCDFNSIREGIKTRGMVMYFGNPAHKPVQEAVANDPQVAEAMKKIANGSASLTAPSASAENEWTEEDKARLDKALGQYFPEK